MNKLLSKYLFYYPATMLKGEFLPYYWRGYEERQWWSTCEIDAYQKKHFEKILKYSFLQSDYYKESFSGSLSETLVKPIAELPTLSKVELINNLEKIRVDRIDLFKSVKTTGGSTGEPVKILKNASALARERCATWRAYEWAGVSLSDRQVRFWGVPHSRRGRFKAEITDIIANRKRISAFSINDDNLYKYYDSICKFKPKYLYGYVSVIEEFARFIKSNNLMPPSCLKSLITTSEVLTDYTRNFIENVFQCRVFNEYGCGEVGSIAHECEYGRMHVMADNLRVEIDSTRHGEAGEVIVTDLFNFITPLIRYRVGDFATLSDEKCPCGRGLPVIKKIHGRAYDIIKTPGGTRIHPEAVIYIFEGIQEKMPVFKQFQVIQTELNTILVNVVPNRSWKESYGDALRKQLALAIGSEFRYEVNLVESLPRENSGKMRVVKSLVF